MKIVFLSVSSEDKKIVKRVFPKALIFEKALDKKIIKEINGAEIICVSIQSKITAEVINSFKNLKLIVTRSVGYDHIDLEAAGKRGIVVANIPDYGSHIIAEFVFALLLSGLRYVDKGDKRVEKIKGFSRAGLRGTALKGKTLGIVGTGKIGINVARIASLGFLMNVLAYDTYPKKELAKKNKFSYVSLSSIWKESDIITLHCPLLLETKHMINKKSIAQMKDGVVIVNTSRGGIIDTKALVAGIKSGKVSHAFLDVLEHEDNIIKDKELIKLPNVITTPHIAFYADDSMEKMYESAFETIKKYLKNKEIKNKVIGN